MESIILASKSPRRRDLFESVGLPFEVVVPNVIESEHEDESPSRMSLRLACEKAEEVSWRFPGRLTIGADTVVDVDGVPFGKPLDRDDALRMLRALNGREHLVHTGIAAALSGSILHSAVETTEVLFGKFTDLELLTFAESGEGDDKAGAYAVQGRGALLVERISGCYYNVVGLPLFRLNRMFKSLGFDFLFSGGAVNNAKAL